MSSSKPQKEFISFADLAKHLKEKSQAMNISHLKKLKEEPQQDK